MSARGISRAFGRAVPEYERGRPEWPLQVLERVPVSEDAEVLDLAAGSGKLTRALAGRYRRVVAVEPDDAMRAVISGVEVLSGTAEAIPLPDGAVDAVFVGDAFHWFDAAAALREIARVLRPRGVLVLLWNIWGAEAFDSPIPEEALAPLFAAYERAGRPGGFRYVSGAWKEPFPESRFESLREQQLESEVSMDAETIVSLWLSVSSVASLPDTERADLGAQLRRLLPGDRRLSLRTDLYWTRLR